eukprot:3229793-Ditylum_brightwellii.AAC.1
MKANEQFNIQGLLGGPQGSQQQMGARGNQLQQVNNSVMAGSNGTSSSYLSNIMGGANAPAPGVGGSNSMANSPGLSMGNMAMSPTDSSSPGIMGIANMQGQHPQKGMSCQGQQSMDGMRRSMMGDQQQANLGGFNHMGKDLTVQQQQQLLMSQMNQKDTSGKNAGQQSSQQAMFEQQYKQFQMMQRLQQERAGSAGSIASGGSVGEREEPDPIGT